MANNRHFFQPEVAAHRQLTILAEYLSNGSWVIALCNGWAAKLFSFLLHFYGVCFLLVISLFLRLIRVAASGENHSNTTCAAHLMSQ